MGVDVFEQTAMGCETLEEAMIKKWNTRDENHKRKLVWPKDLPVKLEKGE
jgi:hypothetical protein